MSTQRNIKKEMLTVKGSDFAKWHNSLSNEERLEYSFILEGLKNQRPDKKIDK
jgi:hypothetical protein